MASEADAGVSEGIPNFTRDDDNNDRRSTSEGQLGQYGQSCAVTVRSSTARDLLLG